MIIFFLGLVFIATCMFLILVILLQSGKGSGLSGMLGGSNPLMDSLGATGTEKALSKWTTISAVVFFIIALTLTLLGGKLMKGTRLSDQLKSTAAPASAPAIPGQTAPTEQTVPTGEKPQAEKASGPTAPVSNAPQPATPSAGK
jgi:preprotein translocase subunit SecG